MFSLYIQKFKYWFLNLTSFCFLQYLVAMSSRGYLHIHKKKKNLKLPVPVLKGQPFNFCEYLISLTVGEAYLKCNLLSLYYLSLYIYHVLFYRLSK